MTAEQQDSFGFGDLYRFYHRELSNDFDDHAASKMATVMIECWRKNRYIYSDLEEMCLFNLQHNQDRELLARELGSTIGDNREDFPTGLSSTMLVDLTIKFFNTVSRRPADHSHGDKMETGSVSSVEETRVRKNSKYDGLRPVTMCLESIFERGGLQKTRTKVVAGNITERLVIAGYGWDRILQYQLRGRDKFNKKLIPHIYMSKDDFPPGMDTDHVLNQLYDYIETWKFKLFDVLSTGGTHDDDHTHDLVSPQKETKYASTSHQPPLEDQQPRFEGDKNFPAPRGRGLESKELAFKPTRTKSKYANSYHSEDDAYHRKYDNHREEAFKGGFASETSNDDYHTPNDRQDDRKRSLKDKWHKEYDRNQSRDRSDSWRGKQRSGFDSEDHSDNVDQGSYRYEKIYRDYDARDKQVPKRQRPTSRDFDARRERQDEQKPMRRSAKDVDGYVSVEDKDGKTTFYHYTDKSMQGRSRSPNERMRDKLKKEASEEPAFKQYRKRRMSSRETQEEDDEERYEEREEKARTPSPAKKTTMLKGKVLRKKKKEKIKQQQQTVHGSLLEKVTEILKSCNDFHPVAKPVEDQKIKEELDSPEPQEKKPKPVEHPKHMSFSKLTKPMMKETPKVEESPIPLRKHEVREPKDDELSIVADKSLEDGEVTDEDTVNDVDDTVLDTNEAELKKLKRKVLVFDTTKEPPVIKEEKEVEIKPEDVERAFSARSPVAQTMISPIPSSSKPPIPTRSRSRSRHSSRHRSRSRGSRSGSRHRSRSRSRYDSRSRSRSRTRSRSRSHHYHGSSRSRSRSSRSRSRSPRRRYYSPKHRGYHGGRGGRYQNSRGRPPHPASNSKHNVWIPVCPCAMVETVELEELSSTLVRIAVKEEYSFRKNVGAMVRVTKWTGRDTVAGIEIRPQIVTLEESCMMEVEVRNPFRDKKMVLESGDKIVCLSVLAGPIKEEDQRNEECPENMETADKRWFHMSAVILHRKGTLDRILIHPGRTMKVISTIIGPIKKYAGRDIMISKLESNKDFPVHSQIVPIGENENVGFEVRNKTSTTIKIYKEGQEVAILSVWATVKLDKNYRGKF